MCVPVASNEVGVPRRFGVHKGGEENLPDRLTFLLHPLTNLFKQAREITQKVKKGSVVPVPSTHGKKVTLHAEDALR